MIRHILLLLGFFYYANIGAQILDFDTTIKIEKGEKTTIRRFLIQINQKEDNWLSEIEIGHEAGDEFSLLKAHVIDSKGSIVRKIRKKDIITRSDRSMNTYYQDGLVEEFDMYWDKYPYQIEYSYRISTSDFIWVAYWHPVVYKNLETVRSSLRLEIPIDYEVSIKDSERLKFEEISDQDKRTLSWIINSYKAPKEELLGPPLLELIPEVLVSASHFRYGVAGSADSWASLGHWQASLNTGTDELPVAEKKVIEKLIEGIEDPAERVKKLFHYLQDRTQYVNVAIDKGGLKSYPASYVSQNKYGDCKALTTYMKALLNTIGIESYYTLINGDENPKRVLTDFPGQQFNHAVLMVPLEEETIWLENTSNSAPFNYMGTFTQNRNALVIDAKNSRLTRTPLLSIDQVADNRTYSFDLAPDEQWIFSFSADFRGKTFERYRYFNKNLSSADQENAIRQDFLPVGFDIRDWDLEVTDRDDRSMKMSADGHCDSPILKMGHLKMIKPVRIEIPDVKRPEERKSGVRINFPINRSNSTIVELSPQIVKALELPEEVWHQTKYGYYSIRCEVTERALVIQESFVLNAGEYPKSEYQDFYSFIAKIKNSQKSLNILIK